jgi:hypothetical protein
MMLFWEQFRQTWFYLAFSALVLWLIGYVLSREEAYDELLSRIHLLVAIVTFFFVFLEGSSRDLGLLTPKRRFTLPNSTYALFTAMGLYRIVIMLVYCGFLGWVQVRYLSQAILPPVWIYPLLVCPMVLWMQSLLYHLDAYGFRLGTVWWLIQGLPALAGGWVILVVCVPRIWTPDMWVLSFTLYVVLVLSGGVSGYIAFRDARHKATGKAPHFALFQWLVPLKMSFDPFILSPFFTQVWFEWRTYMAWLPKITALVIAINFGLSWVLRLFVTSIGLYDYILPDIASVIFPSVVAFVVGYYALRCPAGYLAFCGTRPVPLKTLVFAKIVAGGAAALAAIGVTVPIILANIGLSNLILGLQHLAPLSREYLEMMSVLIFTGSAWLVLFTGRLFLIVWLTTAAWLVFIEEVFGIDGSWTAVGVLLALIVLCLMIAALIARNRGHDWFQHIAWGRIVQVVSPVLLLAFVGYLIKEPVYVYSFLTVFFAVIAFVWTYLVMYRRRFQ